MNNTFEKIALDAMIDEIEKISGLPILDKTKSLIMGAFSSQKKNVIRPAVGFSRAVSPIKKRTVIIHDTDAPFSPRDAVSKMHANRDTISRFRQMLSTMNDGTNAGQSFSVA
jgi:hypothetical protein